MAVVHADKNIACPGCKKKGTIIKGKEEYGGGWVCWKNAKPEAGCGQKISDAVMRNLAGVAPDAEVPTDDSEKKDKSVDLGDYVDVAERLRLFLADHPDGRIQPYKDPELSVFQNQAFWIYAVAVYRDSEDARPSIAYASEPFPGTTPYTRNSELMNAETSAIGRALGLMGYGINHSIASKQEVENRKADANGEIKPENAAPESQQVVTATRAERVEALKKAATPLVPGDNGHKEFRRPEAPVVGPDASEDWFAGLSAEPPKKGHGR